MKELDDWTPMPSCGPNGRLPTKEDGRLFYLTLRGEGGTYFTSGGWTRDNFPPNTVAWRKLEKIKPWNPPEPEKMERCEFTDVVSVTLADGVRNVVFDVDQSRGPVSLRQVLPGDPTPEAVREVRSLLRTRASMHRGRGEVGYAEGCDNLVSKLDGK